MSGQPVQARSPQDACLVDFAQSLTARPWAIGPAAIQRLFAAGLSRPSIVLAIGLVAMFNYLTRVADGTGIEADYGTELPQFTYRGITGSDPRPEPALWPPVDGSIQLLSLVPGSYEPWRRWREYVLSSPVPIPLPMRRQLRAIAARNACDGAADAGTGAFRARIGSTSAGVLPAFADTLSRTPWLVTAANIDELRSVGLDDPAILHVIAVVAYQSAESRLRIGLSALARFGLD